MMRRITHHKKPFSTHFSNFQRQAQDLRLRKALLPPEKVSEPFQSFRLNTRPLTEETRIPAPKLVSWISFGKTPNITIVDKIVTLPESQIFRSGENSFNLNIDPVQVFPFLIASIPRRRGIRASTPSALTTIRARTISLPGVHNGYGAELSVIVTHRFRSGVHHHFGAISLR
jgi:hypothetical protein